MLRIFVRRVFASLRRRARLRQAIADPQCGAVTFVQRFGGALNLNVHFHTLVLDGVYDTEDGMRFLEVDVLECPECQGPMRVLAAIHPPEATRAILECLGLPSRAPSVASPRFDGADDGSWEVS